jgi:hypothetical protein
MFLQLLVKDILIQPDIDGRRSKWIARILEFDLEIKPTKLVKGQGLAKLLVESNCKYLEVNFINTCSENQQAKVSDKIPSRQPPIGRMCTGTKILYIFCKVATSRWNGEKARQEI